MDDLADFEEYLDSKNSPAFNNTKFISPFYLKKI